MKNLYKYLFLIFIVTSCSKDDTLGNGSEGTIPVTFSTGVGLQASETRATIEGTKMPEGKYVGLFGVTYSNDEYQKYLNEAEEGKADRLNSYNFPIGNFAKNYGMAYRELEGQYHQNLFNAKYKVGAYDSSILGSPLENTGDNAKYPDGSNSGIVFYGYYPYAARTYYKEGKGQRFYVKINVDSIETTTDYLYTGPISQRTTADAAKVEFQHAMSRINLYLYTDKSDAALNKMNKRVKLMSIVAIMNTSNEGMMNVMNGEVELSNQYGVEGVQNYDLTRTDTWLPYVAASNIEANVDFIKDKVTPHSLLFFRSTDLQQIYIKLYNPVTENSQDFIIYEQGGEQDIELLKGYTTNIFVDYSPSNISVSSSVRKWADLEDYSKYISTDPSTGKEVCGDEKKK